MSRLYFAHGRGNTVDEGCSNKAEKRVEPPHTSYFCLCFVSYFLICSLFSFFAYASRLTRHLSGHDALPSRQTQIVSPFFRLSERSKPATAIVWLVRIENIRTLSMDTWPPVFGTLFPVTPSVYTVLHPQVPDKGALAEAIGGCSTASLGRFWMLSGCTP
ncbi:hypothetical protein GGI35DRAFT_453751 [Trichoderma velutinum]